MWPFKQSTPKGPTPTGKIINAWEHKGWGNAINVDNWEGGKIWGHLPFRLQIGDEIRFKMKSGMIGRTLIQSIKQMVDPPDMFFATFFAVGYLEGEAEPETVQSTVRFLI